MSYVEHRTLEVGPLLVADSTMDSGARLCWVGAGGLDGRWVTHAEFRAIVAALIEFAEKLPPSGQSVPASGALASSASSVNPASEGSEPDEQEPTRPQE